MAQKQVLLTLGLAAVLVVGFQNCSGVQFDSGLASGKATNDLPDINIEDDFGTRDPDSQPPNKVPDVVVVPPAPAEPGKVPCDQPPVILQPSDTGPRMAANCKMLREMYKQSGIEPAVVRSISQSGKTKVGPRFVSSVKTVSVSGTSSVYLVGSSSGSLVDQASLSGTGHVVLCGINVKDAGLSGTSNLDLIGSNVLGNTNLSGTSEIGMFDENGNSLNP